MKSVDHKTKNGTNELQAKVFTERESLLTELLELKHFKILKHIFLAILFGFVATDLVKALAGKSHAHFGLKLIKTGFNNFHYGVVCWLVQFGINLLTYKFFKIWALKRIEYGPKDLLTKLWDTLFIVICILYYISAVFLFPVLWADMNLGIATLFAVLMENVRLLMKSHAFIRSNVPDVLKHKQHSDEHLDLPTLKHYLYFSFAPTLLYRKEYPRTETRNLKRALLHFLDVLGIIWLESYIYEIFFLHSFANFGKGEVDWMHVAVIVTQNAIAGGLIMLVNFYLILHAWCNCFADLMRFADKRFYEDWWTSTNYSVYFRSWNIVVHDWLYEYIYKDFYYYIIPKNKIFARFIVFLLSALIHEQIIGFAVGHFLPILFVLFFCFGAIFNSLRTKHPAFYRQLNTSQEPTVRPSIKTDYRLYQDFLL
ncbi:MBOAT, membrane-bound O-acyltransferase family [Popillia japonica]|uniref:O-acyltransferase n=1 Tax=Popillia japonica TaxID=7064 RepID=A0AAW1MMC4_POPJA